MSISLDEERKLNDKYNCFASLLLEFYLCYKRLDEDTLDKCMKTYIKRFKNNIKEIQDTILEGRKILALEPFPWEWVTDTCNSYPYGDPTKNTKEDCYLWVKWFIDLLEEKAIAAGVLDEKL